MRSAWAGVTLLGILLVALLELVTSCNCDEPITEIISLSDAGLDVQTEGAAASGQLCQLCGPDVYSCRLVSDGGAVECFVPRGCE